jgi:hypothetical protein
MPERCQALEGGVGKSGDIAANPWQTPFWGRVQKHLSSCAPKDARANDSLTRFQITLDRFPVHVFDRQYLPHMWYTIDALNKSRYWARIVI